MDRTLHLVGINSGEIIMVRYPRSLLNFCEFDLAYFAENAIAVCDRALKDGDLDFDRVTELRNSLKGAHVYIESNIRTTYDKIVLDCWIDYVCRRDNVGTGALWNRFMPCSTAFEKAVFTRLCDYRYNRAINEWLNLVRVQDYAKNKISFVFAGDISSAAEAAARRNYFDLMFSVTAQELGCHVEELGVTKVFSVGRIPSAAFMFPNISKDIVKNLLADFDYSENYSDSSHSGSLSDQIAMDAFSYMKSGLAQEYASYNITRSEIENSPRKIYMPCGLKAVADLEIDALIESGGWLARCKRCGRYFVRDDSYTAEYCSLFNPGGKTCLQIYEQEHPQSRIPAELQKKFTEITDEMYSRVNVSMDLSEYESWKVYLDALYEKADKGEIPVEELESFISYSHSLDISRSNPVRVVAKRADRPSKERVVKPFIPKRIDRSELDAQEKPRSVPDDEEEREDEPVSGARKAFFTSPSVQQRRQNSQRDTSVTRLIRAEEANAPRTNTFTPFGQASATEPKPLYERPITPVFDQAPPPSEPAPQPVQEPAPEIDMERVSELLGKLAKLESEKHSRAAVPKSEQTAPAPKFEPTAPKSAPVAKFEQIAPVKSEPTASEAVHAAKPQAGQPVFDLFGDVKYDSEDALETHGNMFDLERDSAAEVKPQQAEINPPAAPQTDFAEVPAPPKPKVIKKNAAAISAYGKIAGTPITAAPQFSAVSQPDTEPFKDVSAIFDGVEKSGSAEVSQPSTDSGNSAAAQEKNVEPPVISMPEKAPEKAEEKPSQPRDIPEKVTEDNVPSGIWTEERSLFPEPDPEELEMLKEKKRTRSNKTQRLFDAIMREPEDNPNVRTRKR